MQNSSLNEPYNYILIVDDIPENLRFLSEALMERNYQVRCAKNGEMALLAAKKELPQIILLDIKMPGMDGYEVCEKLKSDDLTCNIPVIFLSALDDVFDKVKAFAVGGADYITKPFHIEEVIARIHHQLLLQSAKVEINRLNVELEEKVQQRTAQLETVVHQLNQEILQHKKTQEELTYQALHDALTGLPNRNLFTEHLQEALRRSARNEDYLFAVLFIDLDRFKVINDSWGHAIGDQLLIAISRILKECSRSTDTVARLSGDEFTLLLENIRDFQDAVRTAERLLETLNAPIHLKTCKVYTAASIGIVLGSAAYQNSVDLLRDADIAMYRAKTLGKGRYAIFDREMHAQTLHLLQRETDLRHAVEHQEFILNYQPIISLTTGCITGFEALIRWQHPQMGLIYPDQFITIAEDTGLIVLIGEWVLQEACQQLYIWQQKFPTASSLQISVNLSSRQIKQFDFAKKLAEILKNIGLSGDSLKLELTETILMDRGEKTIELLSQIKEQKIQLSIDDFGTGYSSLSYLHSFPIDALKIDRSFVSPMTEGKNGEIIRTIITLAHSLGIKSIAEGVETSHQLAELKKLGCDEAQGYFFSKPVSAQIAESLIAENPQW